MTTDPTAAAKLERILVVEDQVTQAERTRHFLTGLGYEVCIAATAAAGLAAMREFRPDGLLLDIELPDRNGLELLDQIREDGNDAIVITLTATASLEMAKAAIRRGADDYVVKPYSQDRLATTLHDALQRRASGCRRQQAAALATAPHEPLARTAAARRAQNGFAGFIGASAPMRAVYDVIQSVARSKASVFITGESGTGKELVAEALHDASPRAGRQFVALNCGAIPRDLLESELFGHVKGAFTGATADRVGAAKLADGGTLFFDEIGEMPLDMQVKLLRFVQTGTFRAVGSSKLERLDVRFVCATNRDPVQDVQSGRFREDLYYRLYVVPVALPPLRERGEDVLLIARHFLAQFSREDGRRFRGFTPEAERVLLSFSWPGNVRQLQNVVRNIAVLHDGELVTPAMIPPPVNRHNRAAPHIACPPVPQRLSAWTTPPQTPPTAVEDVRAEPDVTSVAPPEATPIPDPAPACPRPDHALVPEIDVIPLAEMERRLVFAALARTDKDIPRAAALLEINPSTVYRKVSAWRKDGLVPPWG